MGAGCHVERLFGLTRSIGRLLLLLGDVLAILDLLFVDERLGDDLLDGQWLGLGLLDHCDRGFATRGLVLVRQRIPGLVRSLQSFRRRVAGANQRGALGDLGVFCLGGRLGQRQQVQYVEANRGVDVGARVHLARDQPLQSLGVLDEQRGLFLELRASTLIGGGGVRNRAVGRQTLRPDLGRQGIERGQRVSQGQARLPHRIERLDGRGRDVAGRRLGVQGGQCGGPKLAIEHEQRLGIDRGVERAVDKRPDRSGPSGQIREGGRGGRLIGWGRVRAGLGVSFMRQRWLRGRFRLLSPSKRHRRENEHRSEKPADPCSAPNHCRVSTRLRTQGITISEVSATPT